MSGTDDSAPRDCDMVNSTGIATGFVLAVAVQLSGCALAPSAPDEAQRQGAWQRWNGCLGRYNVNLEHYCDGHRRDVLATYPIYHQYRINRLLTKQTRALNEARNLKTALEEDDEER